MASPREPSKPRRPFPRVPFLAWAAMLGALAASEALAPGHLAGAPDAGVDAGTPEDVAVDVKPETSLTSQAGRHMPPAPEKGWKRPPCGEVQVELNGACWLLPAKADGTLPKPPCPRGLYEYRGRCFQPVGAVVRPPTSIEE